VSESISNVLGHIISKAQQKLIQTLQLPKIEARIEVQILLNSILPQATRAWLIAHENDALEANIHADFQALLNRRLKGEPIAHIIGHREFYGMVLQVTTDTLIPRPDTETLVEAALSRIPENRNVSVLDLGTGTGAIALAIANHRPQAEVIAVDASKKALAVAKNNAQRLAINNVSFQVSNWYDALEDGRFDLIVSNPPYIEQDDAHLQQGDLRFEPLSALASGEDGLDDIRHIIAHALIHLKPQGWLMLEHGYNQAESVSDLMADTGLVDIATIQDLGGNDRVTIGKNPLIVSTHWG
jgi:release factor glutamine methyltransferase